MNVPAPKVGPELKSVSPSQQRTFKLCRRKHWLEKRCKIPQPQGEAAADGEAVHTVIEPYYETGKPVVPADHPERLRIGLQSFLQLLKDPDAPKYKPGLLVEYPRSRRMDIKAADVPVWGRIDLVVPPEKGITTVVDWKSSKWTAYRKSAEELLRDEQCAVYSWFAFEKIPGTEAVIFAHGCLGMAEVDGEYIPTDPITRDQARQAFEEIIEPVVPEMQKHFALDRFEDTEPNYGACDSFGGCPYASYCGVVLKPRPGATTSTPPPEEGSTSMSTPSLKDRLAAKVRAQGINPPDAAKPAPVTPYVPPASTPAPAIDVKAEIANIRASFANLMNELERAFGPGGT